MALEDVAEAKLGKMLDRTKHTAGTQLPYLRNINVRWGEFDLSDVLTMCFEDNELDRYGLAPGDVVVCEGGEPGRAAVWDDRAPGMRFQKALHRVRPSQALLPHWLVLQLRHAATNGRLDELFTGTTIKHLTGASLARFELTLPPAAEQQRVVARIEELTARSRRAKQALDAVPPLLEKLRQSILAAAFRGDLTADWRANNPDAAPANTLLQRILSERRAHWEATELAKLHAKGKHPSDDRWKARYDEPLTAEATQEYELPAGWAWASVDALAVTTDYGSSAKTNDDSKGVPVLRMGNIFEGQLRFDDLKYLPRNHDEFPGLLLEEGDLLFNRTNSVELVGKTAVYEGTPSPSSFASYLIRLRLCRGYAPRLLSYFINSPMGRSWVYSVAAQQVGQANVNGTKLRSLAVPVPPEREQAEILHLLDAAVDALRSAKARVDLERHRLDRLDESVLAKAFRGELVPQDPNDEPAAALLERIRASRADGDGGAAKKSPRKNQSPSTSGSLRSPSAQGNRRSARGSRRDG